MHLLRDARVAEGGHLEVVDLHVSGWRLRWPRRASGGGVKIDLPFRSAVDGLVEANRFEEERAQLGDFGPERSLQEGGPRPHRLAGRVPEHRSGVVLADVRLHIRESMVWAG